MARIKVMKLWTAIVTAFLALFAALGVATTNASAAVQQTETTRNSHSDRGRNTGRSTPQPAARTASPWSWARTGALPPTMKQRIHAEAHGNAPRCRHRPDESPAAPSPCTPGTASEEPLTPEIPLQR
ncbi:DUF6344 domain-containing protein [Streptomyces sp. NPDC005925]|uniref:DUF6344 domain-containing protein n=1 Tax=Streptomyces sp. NPDC005925 TaxID=3157172 RepID=UPI0033EDD706